MLKLYNYYRSSASFRARIALNLKGVDYQEIPVHLLRHGGEQFLSDYQAINPQCLIPTLQHGEKIITQSMAIIEYINDCYPDPPLLPEDIYQKAQVRAFALTIVADVHPLNNLRVLHYLTQELAITEKQKTTWYQHWIAKGFIALEKNLKNAGDFCFGNSPSLADICLVPQMYNARRYACDLSDYPTLVRIDANCQKQKAFVKAWPNE